MMFPGKNPKHGLFAISDFIRKIMTHHDSYDLQDPDLFTIMFSRIPCAVHDPWVWLIPMMDDLSWWLQAL